VRNMPLGTEQCQVPLSPHQCPKEQAEGP
jgi:hypothetical protein